MSAKGAALRTTNTRVMRDVGVKLDAICRYEGVRAADFLDPLIRKAIEKRFNELPEEYREKVLTRAGLADD